MKKTIFKKILCIINYINQQVEHMDLAATIHQQLEEENIHLSLKQIQDIISYIEDTEILYKDKAGYDLIPCACVFAKSDHHSLSEALAFAECLMKQPSHLRYMHQIVDLEYDVNLQEVLDENTFDIAAQTMLCMLKKDNYLLNPFLIPEIRAIVKEYEHNDNLMISTTLSAIYANSLIHHEDESIQYRNMDHQIVAYDQLDQILEIIPRRGIPVNRDITKPVQVFYKDTLMHEFHHCCPICGIDIPHMLIASHIKPFRDCAHIFEALDHNNGLLLCRNHDYLFDQGYISFDVNGRQIICHALKKKEHMQHIFHIDDTWKLPDEYLHKDRKLFFQYHRKHIFKGN